MAPLAILQNAFAQRYLENKMKRLLSVLHVILAIILSFALLIAIYTATHLLVPSVASASFLDLIVNNFTNLFIALYFSTFIVRKFELRQQSVAFFIDLTKQTNDLCADMLEMDFNQLIMHKQRYIGQANMLIEYSEALQDQIKNLKRRRQQRILVEEMINTSKSHYSSAKKVLGRSNFSQSDYDDLQSLVIAVQTHIPRIMATIKH